MEFASRPHGTLPVASGPQLWRSEGLPGVGRAARQAGPQGRGGHSRPQVERVSVGGSPSALPRPRERRPTSSRARREQA
eukprot:3526710-Pyramimonas_sp.AAC.1